MSGLTPIQKEQIARNAGYSSYEAMIAFQRQLARQRQPQTAAQKPVVQQAEQAVNQGMSWHPRNIFNYIGEVLKNANRKAE
jgi:hypothetical protein